MIDVTSLQMKGALYCNNLTIAPRNDPENEPWPFTTHVKVTWSLCSIWPHGGTVSDRYVTHVSSYTCLERSSIVDEVLSCYRTNHITTRIQVAEFLKTCCLQLVKNYPHFVEPEIPVFCSEGPSTCLDSEQDNSNQLYLFIYLFHIHFNIIFPPTIWPPKKSFPPKPAAHSLTQTPSHAACSSAFPVPVPSGRLQPVFCPHVTVQSHTNDSCTLCSTRRPERKCGSRLCLNLTCVQICSLRWILFFERNLPSISQNVPFDILKIQTLIKPSQSAQSNMCTGITRRAVPIGASKFRTLQPTKVHKLL